MVLYQKRPAQFKCIISIGKLVCCPYRTIILQVRADKRVMRPIFFLKYLTWPIYFLADCGETADIDKYDDNIVKCVRAGGDCESAKSEDSGKVDAGDSSKEELNERELFAKPYCSVHIEDVVMDAEEDCRRHDRDDYSAYRPYLEQVLQDEHKNAYKYESEDKFFVDSGADSGDDPDEQIRGLVLDGVDPAGDQV